MSKKRNFLKPVALLAATIITASGANASINTSVIPDAVEVNTMVQLVEAPADLPDFIITPSESSVEMAYHSSHASHASHSSHSSHSSHASHASSSY